MSATVLFWIIALALVMLTMLAVFLPLLRSAAADQTHEATLNALKAELAEIGADAGERFASPAEMQAARAEVGRRLLALEQDAPAPAARRASHWAALLALIPIAAVPFYLSVGQPEYPDQRFATRIDRQAIADKREIEGLVARVEQRLRDVPDDGRGWALIAPVYVQLGRLEDAANAYGNAVQHHSGEAKEKASLLADHGEVMVALGQGRVGPMAAQRFNEALAINPDNQKALFFLAMHAEQTGAPEAARAQWQALIDRFAAANPAWLDVARQRLAGLGGNGAAPSGPAAPGPTAADVEAAGQMAPADQQEMIRSMVERLAGKLAAAPDDAEGWTRLIRARTVLGDKPQALKDLEAARSHFAAGTEGRKLIDAFAAAQGL